MRTESTGVNSAILVEDTLEQRKKTDKVAKAISLERKEDNEVDEVAKAILSVQKD